MYLIILFPYKPKEAENECSKTYEDAKEIMDGWKMTGTYEVVLPKQMSIWSKDAVKHQVFCIHAERIQSKDTITSVEEKKDALKLKDLDINYVFTENPLVWLTKSKYQPETVESKL